MKLHSLFLAAVPALGLLACAGTSRAPEQFGSGAGVQLPDPHHSLVPTVNVAPAKGWPPGEMPVAASGFAVAPYATGLDHPRWLYVLPNGDVLVAESNAPPDRPDDGKGVRSWFMHKLMAKAGAGVPSPNRITLLRGVNAAGGAVMRTTFLQGLKSPFGMVLVGRDFYVANTDSLLRFTYHDGDTQLAGAGVKVADLPAGPINHHWTKNVIASRDGTRLYVTVGSNSNVGARTAWRRRKGGPVSSRSIPRAVARGPSPPGCAIRTAWAGIPSPVPCGRRSMSGTSSATTSFPTT